MGVKIRSICASFEVRTGAWLSQGECLQAQLYPTATCLRAIFSVSKQVL